MRIGSIKKFSLAEYPGRKALVVYTQGCEWACPFCRFRSLVKPACFQPAWPEEEVFEMLQIRENQIDAVVVTGGEPLAQAGLAWFLRRIKRLGFAVKLETSGNRPLVLGEILREGLVDYVALDVKGPLANYAKFAGCPVDPGDVELAMELVRGSGVDYEFCTTLVGGLHTVADVIAIAPLVRGAKRYVINDYVSPDNGGGGVHFFPAEDALLAAARATCHANVGEFVLRPAWS